MAVSRIFLSHSHKDNDWCSAFVYELRRYDVDVWYDEHNLYIGAKWVQMIEAELKERDAFWVILTPESWSSAWVQDELALALAQRKPVIGIFRKQVEISGFIQIYQTYDVIGRSGVVAAQLVAAALGLFRLEQPTAPTKPSTKKPVSQSTSLSQLSPLPLKPSATLEGQSSGEEYEYFEIMVRSFGRAYFFRIVNVESGQVLWEDDITPLLKPYRSDNTNLASIERVRRKAKTKGLEDLPEKGPEWYSYRFRRKKP